MQYLQPQTADFYEDNIDGDAEDLKSRKSNITSYSNRTFLGPEVARDTADLHDDKEYDFCSLEQFTSL